MPSPAVALPSTSAVVLDLRLMTISLLLAASLTSRSHLPIQFYGSVVGFTLAGWLPRLASRNCARPENRRRHIPEEGGASRSLSESGI